MPRRHLSRHAVPALLAAALLAACGTRTPDAAAPPMLSAAQPGALADCAALAGRLQFTGARFDAPTAVSAGGLQIAGRPVAAHCLVTGKLNERVSPVDGQTYAIGFQMRLPLAWNGRFFHQGNGGLDGIVQPALGGVGGGGELDHALAQGFAVLSSDAGHNTRQLPLFGRDPQARRDYGYAAVGALTPMAKAVIAQAYGRGPDRSYFGGCSNGGRHALVAAARYADDYDGFIAGNPGFRLPLSAAAQLWGAQQFVRLSNNGDLATAFNPVERQFIADRILARCDALDGARDGIVADMPACQRAFEVARDVPACSGERNGQCLTTAQKDVLSQVFVGGRDGAGRLLYAPFPFDPGLAGNDWASWKFVASITNRDPVAMAYVFQTPPAEPGAAADPRALSLNFDLNQALALVNATSGPFTESAMQFMTPPEADGLRAVQRRGGKLLVYHGVADGVFSAADTAAWMDTLRQRHGATRADGFARLFLVPGMNHCRGGPATDQFDMLSPLVAWVEQGRAPEQVIARARGTGNALPNPEVPAAWAPDRTRPLCPHPRVARYKGSGDIERAENFSCQ